VRQQELVAIDGIELEVYTAPPGDGDVTVCTAHPCFAEAAEGGILSDPFRGIAQVVTVSPRGLGSSSPGNASLSQLVVDLEAVRRSLGIDEWVFAGPSAGGAVGLLYALQFPHSLQGLILSVTTSSWPSVLDDPLSVFSPRYPEWQDALLAESCRLEVTSSPHWLRIRDGLWAFVDQSGPRVIDQSDEVSEPWRAWWREAVHFDVRDRLNDIRVPTLLLGGEQDPVVPVSNMLMLHERIRNSELVIFEQQGHTPMLDAPVDYQREVRRFLRKF